MMDRVKVSENVLQEIIKNLGIRKGAPSHLPLTEGVIELPTEHELTPEIEFKVSSSKVTIKYFIKSRKNRKLVVSGFMEERGGVVTQVDEYYYIQFLEKFARKEETLSHLILITLDILHYVANYSDTEYVTTTEKRTSKPRKNTKGRKSNKKNSRVYLKRRIYELKEVPTNEGKRRYIRRSEAWSVRGHWRTTKTGKRVWISPYRKGKGDGEEEGKTYIL